MTSDSLPKAAEADYLTQPLHRCGALAKDRVCQVAVETSRATLLSRIIRLRLSHDGGAIGAVRGVVGIEGGVVSGC